MLVITIQDGDCTATAEIPTEFGPALRSAIREIRGEIGGRSTGNYIYPQLDALTQASQALAALAGALHQVVPRGDPRYRTRDGRVDE